MTLNYEIVNLKHRLQTPIREDKVQSMFEVDVVRDDDMYILHWAHLATVHVFMGILGSSKGEIIQSQMGESHHQSDHVCVKRKHSPMDELFITLVRLRVGLLNLDLAYRCRVSVSSLSKIITTWMRAVPIHKWEVANPHVFQS